MKSYYFSVSCSILVLLAFAFSMNSSPEKKDALQEDTIVMTDANVENVEVLKLSQGEFLELLKSNEEVSEETIKALEIYGEDEEEEYCYWKRVNVYCGSCYAYYDGCPSSNRRQACKDVWHYICDGEVDTTMELPWYTCC